MNPPTPFLSLYTCDITTAIYRVENELEFEEFRQLNGEIEDELDYYPCNFVLMESGGESYIFPLELIEQDLNSLLQLACKMNSLIVVLN